MQSKTLQLLSSAGKPRPSAGGRVSAESATLWSEGARAGAPGRGGVDTSPCRAPVRLPPHSRGQSRPGDTHCWLLTGDTLLLAGQDLCWGPPSPSPELTFPQTGRLTWRSAGTVETNLPATYLFNSPFLCWDWPLPIALALQASVLSLSASSLEIMIGSQEIAKSSETSQTPSPHFPP